MLQHYRWKKRDQDKYVQFEKCYHIFANSYRELKKIYFSYLFIAAMSDLQWRALTCPKSGPEFVSSLVILKAQHKSRQIQIKAVMT